MEPATFPGSRRSKMKVSNGAERRPTVQRWTKPLATRTSTFVKTWLELGVGLESHSESNEALKFEGHRSDRGDPRHERRHWLVAITENLIVGQLGVFQVATTMLLPIASVNKT
jgi:hypothetical protein